MPVDWILISAAVVVSVFAVFAGVLIWDDFLSGSMRQVPVGRIRPRHGR